MNPTAEDILNSSAWKAAAKKVLTEIHAAFDSVDPADTHELRELAHRRRALGDIRMQLERELRASINLKKTT